VEAALEEPGGPGEPVVIEPDEGESESHDEGACAAFEEMIGVEDYEASYLEALWLGVDLVRSLFLTFFSTFCQDLLFIVYIWSGAILEFGAPPPSQRMEWIWGSNPLQSSPIK
jgi:hypothetical protein